jgi:hypothetical protein
MLRNPFHGRQFHWAINAFADATDIGCPQKVGRRLPFAIDGPFVCNKVGDHASGIALVHTLYPRGCAVGQLIRTNGAYPDVKIPRFFMQSLPTRPGHRQELGLFGQIDFPIGYFWQQRQC